MSFLKDNNEIFDYRDTAFNRNVLVSFTGITTITNNIDNLFDTFIDFRDTLSSIFLYPIKIYPERSGHLITVKGIWDGSVPGLDVTAKIIHTRSNYLYLGQVEISKYFNSFADYSGYTKISIFLPFLGFVVLDTNEIMGKWLQFRLSVDFSSGVGTYIIGTTENELPYNLGTEPTIYADFTKDINGGFTVIGNYNTTIGIELPIGYSNAGDIKRNLALGAVKMATALYTGTTITPPVATVTTYTPPIPKKEPSNLPIPMTSLDVGKKSQPRTRIHSASLSGGNIEINKSKISDVFTDSIDALNRMKSVGNSDRADTPIQTYALGTNIMVCIYRPKIKPISLAYSHLYGLPLGEVRTLSSLSGYTEVSKIHFEGTDFGSCTSTEYSLIEQAFSDGVILP